MYSNDVAIRVSNLSKSYAIYDSPRDRLKQFVAPRLQKLLKRPPEKYFRDFWALRNVTFEVKRGDTVGIVGRNGSGKSTLLQMICGTLTPTSGSIETQGRVAALLELGAGFNPEFSGRENVYLNAALFGLTSEQIDERFDLIAAFADIGQFVDQPVKTYSSGMFVRLAFAVIAHVDADILIVDEALSVGDAVFTQKCMRFIRSFQEKGTLLFVSHDMGAIQNLCKTALWLGGGEVKSAGVSKRVVESYLRHTLQESYGDEVQLSATDRLDTAESDTAIPEEDVSLVDYAARYKVTENLEMAKGWKSGAAEITRVTIETISGRSVAAFEGGEKVKLTIRAMAYRAISRPILGFVFKDRLGQDLFGENTLCIPFDEQVSVSEGESFTGEFIFRLPMLPNGDYAVMASVADGTQFDNTQHHYLHDALIVNVISSKSRFGLVGIPFQGVTFKVD